MSMDIAKSDWRRALPLAGLLLTFIAASSVTWRQPVTSIEMNRNDAAFYLVLARNIVEHGVYSHQQQPPFQPHTEWPPGVPLLYSLPMSFVEDATLAGGRLWIHGFTVLLSSLALIAVYLFVRQRESVTIAITVTAATMSSHAFLDSAQAATADTIAVAAACFTLLLLERWNKSTCNVATFARTWANGQPAHDLANVATPTRCSETTRWGLLLALACVPLIKPYLGMLFPAFLAALFQKRAGSGHRWWGIAQLAVCCLPFAAFMGYSVIAAQQSGTISALTWFATDNPAEIREATGIADPKTAADWLRQSADAVRFHLIYHTVTAPLPWLSWFGVANWNLPARLLVLLIVGGVMVLGAVTSWKQRDAISLSYAASMFAFFVIFACDNARFFTVLTPMCALLFCRGFATFNPKRERGRTLQDVLTQQSHEMTTAESLDAPPLAHASGYMISVLLASALVATGMWMRQRAVYGHDPSPFYTDLYAAMEVVRVNPIVTELLVPYQMREIASLETGKRIRVSNGSATGTARLTFRPHEAALQKRYARHLARDEASESLTGSSFRRIWSSPTQQVHIEVADEKQP